MRKGRPAAVAVALWMLVALPAPFASAGNEIHRCVEAGRVTYTDRGCDGGRGEVVAMASAAALSWTARDPLPGDGRATSILLGMSPRMVYETLGRPRETIATLQGRTLVEYWLYRGAAGTTRVAFQEGRVTRIEAR
jgi:hypothetical protein